MSPVFNSSALRKRWFQLPAFAVIAAAATLGVVGVRAIDAWKTTKRPPAEPRLTNLVGKAVVMGIKPDHVALSLAITASNKKRAEVERVLAEKTDLAVRELVERGVAATEIRVGSPSIEEQSTDNNDTDAFGNYSTHANVTGYDGSQSVEIQSSRIPAVLDAYTAVSMHPRAWLAIEPPTCWLANDLVVRGQLQDAAWADLQQQVARTSLRPGRAVLGRIAQLSQYDVELNNDHQTWACTEGQVGRATVTATYELR